MSQLADEIRQARLDEAMTRVRAAIPPWNEANTELNLANAALVRVLLLHIAQDFPKIKGFSWEISWEYDDEGGYYASTNIYFTGIDYDGPDSDDYYAVQENLLDPASYLDAGAMEHLGPENEEVTIAELKAMTIGS